MCIYGSSVGTLSKSTNVCNPFWTMAVSPVVDKLRAYSNEVKKSIISFKEKSHEKN